MNMVLLTRDPEMRSLASGKNVRTFTVASNEFVGGGREKSEYHPVVAWVLRLVCRIARLGLGFDLRQGRNILRTARCTPHLPGEPEVARAVGPICRYHAAGTRLRGTSTQLIATEGERCVTAP